MASGQDVEPFSTSMVTGTLTAVRDVPQVDFGGASWLAAGAAAGPCGPAPLPLLQPAPVTISPATASGTGAQRAQRMGALLSCAPHHAVGGPRAKADSRLSLNCVASQAGGGRDQFA